MPENTRIFFFSGLKFFERNLGWDSGEEFSFFFRGSSGLGFLNRCSCSGVSQHCQGNARKIPKVHGHTQREPRRTLEENPAETSKNPSERLGSSPRDSGVYTWWTFRIFILARGRGRGSPRRQDGRGSVFLLKIPGGGGLPGEGGRGEGPGGVSAGNVGGGGLNIFSSGPKFPEPLQYKKNSLATNFCLTVPFLEVIFIF